jgi:hypothetical protein
MSHLAKKSGFILEDRAWCGHHFSGRDKVYVTRNQLARVADHCTTCVALYDAQIKKPHHTLDGHPIRGRHDR